MKQINSLLCGVAMAAAALLLTACGGSSRMTKSTSSRVELAHTVRFIPSQAALTVSPERVTATLQSYELESLDAEQARQTVVAKALATANGDVLLAPRFTYEKAPDGKTTTSITVVGYAATISSFRPITEADVEIPDTLMFKQRPMNKTSYSTMTVADVEYATKASISLTAAELTGKSEEAALRLAKEKLLRQEKADVLFDTHYTMSQNNGILTAFSLTAFPGKYVNYRQTTLRELEIIKPTTKPQVLYQTIAADIVPVAARAQLKFGTNNAPMSQSELKEMARAAALQKYNADFLLNETFYFDYQDKIITHVTICGTPAVYANFRPLQKNDVADIELVPIEGDVQAEQQATKTNWLDSILGIFKKK